MTLLLPEESFEVPLLWINIALSKVLLVEINILHPVVTVPGYCYLQPRFHVSIVMYDGSSFDFLLVDTRVVSEA